MPVIEPSDQIPDELNSLRALIDSDLISPREKQVLTRITEVAPILYSAIKSTYPHRGWRVCGPASAGLSRMLSYDLEIPIGTDLEGEHMELSVGIYDPITVDGLAADQFTDRDKYRKATFEEQTYIRYYSPDGKVFYIDPIFGLLMEGRDETIDPVVVEMYTPESLDAEIARRHNVFDFVRYPQNNFYHGEQFVWTHHRELAQDDNPNTTQILMGASIIHEHIATQQVLNNIAYDGIKFVYTDNTSTQFIEADYASLLVALSERGYPNLIDSLISQHPNSTKLVTMHQSAEEIYKQRLPELVKYMRDRANGLRS